MTVKYTPWFSTQPFGRGEPDFHPPSVLRRENFVEYFSITLGSRPYQIFNNGVGFRVTSFFYTQNVAPYFDLWTW